MVVAIDEALKDDPDGKNCIVIDSVPSGMPSPMIVISGPSPAKEYFANMGFHLYPHQIEALEMLDRMPKTIVMKFTGRPLRPPGILVVDECCELKRGMLERGTEIHRQIEQRMISPTGRHLAGSIFTGMQHHWDIPFMDYCRDLKFFDWKNELKELPYYADRKEYWLRQGREGTPGRPKKHRDKTKQGRASRKLNRKIKNKR
jgi:hypothetical protein